ncbi:hypothetical protein GWK47_017666 [Chionoecetes opilio]|uniref:Uncharacterized protein n=1 Tax=Chionoecetes opilio TaxID=41210 RepID=A0A8J5CJQ0_CHIOP|nr:hypothetical protein GWK47_017666 [Chionoecetes opilio]
MISAVYQKAPPSTCHYCTFWSVRRPNLPSKAVRAPRVPTTSKGILKCRQLYSSINGNVESGLQLSPETTSILDQNGPEIKIIPVHETTKTQDQISDCEDCFEVDNQTTEEAALNGKHAQDALSETGADGDAAPLAVLQDHVYCLSVSLHIHVFSAKHFCHQHSYGAEE